MPHIRVDMFEKHRPRMDEISEALHNALVVGLDMIADDLFQIFTLHGEDELKFSRTFPQADRDDIIYIQVLASYGYPAEVKDKMYAEIVRNMTGLGISPDTLLISVVEIEGSTNWHSPAATV